MKRLGVAAALIVGAAACGGGSSNWQIKGGRSLSKAKKHRAVKKCNKGDGRSCFEAGLSYGLSSTVRWLIVGGQKSPALLLEAPDFDYAYPMNMGFAGLMFEKGCKLNHLPSCVVASDWIASESPMYPDKGRLYKGKNKARAKAATPYAEKACRGDYLSGCKILMKATALTGDTEKEIWATERVCDLGGDAKGC